MKNIILLFAFAFFMGNNSFAQGIQFDKGDWQEILAKAKEEDKLIFVDAYAAWCGPCKKMARDVFTKPEVGEFFNAQLSATGHDRCLSNPRLDVHCDAEGGHEDRL